MRSVRGPINYATLARVERDFTGGVTLHLIRDNEHVELHGNDEFLIVNTKVNPFKDVPNAD